MRYTVVLGLLLLAAVPAAAQAPAAAPATSLVQVALGLVAVLAAVLAGLYVLKRLAAPRGAASGLLRVVAAAAVGPRERVVVVEVGESWLVVGVAPGRVNALHTLPRQELPQPQAALQGAGKDFAARLARLVERRNER